jgi:hypothetical protein
MPGTLGVPGRQVARESDPPGKREARAHRWDDAARAHLALYQRAGDEAD